MNIEGIGKTENGEIKRERLHEIVRQRGKEEYLIGRSRKEVYIMCRDSGAIRRGYQRGQRAINRDGEREYRERYRLRERKGERLREKSKEIMQDMVKGIKMKRNTL